MLRLWWLSAARGPGGPANRGFGTSQPLWAAIFPFSRVDRFRLLRGPSIPGSQKNIQTIPDHRVRSMGSKPLGTSRDTRDNAAITNSQSVPSFRPDPTDSGQLK